MALLEEDAKQSLHHTGKKMVLLKQKPVKDRLTLLLCSNIGTNLKIKSLLVYHSQAPGPFMFKNQNVNKAILPVMWRANAKYLGNMAIVHGMATQSLCPVLRNIFLTTNCLKGAF